MASEIEAVKLKHAEHILAVVRGAEKQEAARQKRLRRASSKENLAYLQKRFNAERRKDRAQISGLVHDATAVETALLHGGRRRRTCDGDSGQGGGGSSTGRTAGSNTSTKSHAYVETSKPTQDPHNISLDQMRFMKYVYAHIDGEKAARAQARLMAQLVSGEKSADKQQAREHTRRRRNRSKAGIQEVLGRNRVISGTTEALAGLGVSLEVDKARNIPDNNSTVAASGGKRGVGIPSYIGGSGGDVSGSRQRLLEKKRNILLEMKGVVSRQAEALDRLVENNAVTSGAGKGRRGGGGCRRGGGQSLNRSNSDSFQGSGLRTEGATPHRASGSGSAPLDHAPRSASCADAPQSLILTPSTRSSVSTAWPKAPLPLARPRPPENDTSAFLARGGRWGGESRRASSRRGSVAAMSSASYATYCKRDLDNGRAVPRVNRRPALVPFLPL
ncbi:unnamed protein product [Scytosiphon promiscuus]